MRVRDLLDALWHPDNEEDINSSPDELKVKVASSDTDWSILSVYYSPEEDAVILDIGEVP